MQKKIKFAVLGCGHIGKRHAEIILSNAASELVALCDVQRVDTFYPGIPFYYSIEELFNSGIVFDVLVIATPNGNHAEHAIYALEKQTHVLIEKPIALSKTDAERIIFKALQVHKHVFAVMQNRYSPPSIWLKEIMNTKLLGKIFMVQVNCLWNRDERYYTSDTWHGTADLDGGTLFTQFSHFIDILYWLFGDIKNIQSRLRDFKHQQTTAFEDSGFVSFDFVNGGMGCINYTTAVWNNNLESSITIIAENGSVKIGGQYMNEVQVCNIRNYEMPSLHNESTTKRNAENKDFIQNHQYVIENVIDVLNGRAPVSVNALEGLKVCDIIERIYQADSSLLTTTSRPVFFEG